MKIIAIIIVVSISFLSGVYYNKHIGERIIVEISDKNYKSLTAEFNEAYKLHLYFRNELNVIDSNLLIDPIYYPLEKDSNNVKILVLPSRMNSRIKPFINYSTEVYLVTKRDLYYLKPIRVFVNDKDK